MSFSMSGDVNRDVTITFIGRDQASASMRSISASATKTTRITQALTKSLKYAGLAAASALAVGAALAAKALFDAVKAAYADDLAMKKLAYTQAKAQDATEAQTRATADWIDKMELATRFADDEMRPALAALALTGMDVKRSQNLLTIAMDVAEAKGKSLQTVSEALAKAYNGQLTGLQRLGVKVTDASGETLKFSEVLRKLKDRTEGAARAAAKSDPWTVLGHAFEQVKEEVGKQFLPMLRKLMKYIITRVVPWVKDQLVPAVKKFTRWITDEAVPFVRDKLIPALEDLYTVFNEKIKPVLDDTSRNARDLWKSLNQLWGTVEDITSGAGDTNKALEMIRWGFVALFTPINALLGLMRNLIDAFNWILENAGRLVDAVGKIGEVGGWVQEKIGGAVGGAFSADGGWLDRRAMGGWTMVGEHGPELINNRGFVKTHSQSMGAGGGPQVVFTGPVYGDPAAFGRYVERALAKHRRGSGRGGLT